MILGFGFASFAMWARKCAVVLIEKKQATVGRPATPVSVLLGIGQRSVNGEPIHSVSAHFLASIARSACTAVYPKLEFT